MKNLSFRTTLPLLRHEHQMIRRANFYNFLNKTENKTKYGFTLGKLIFLIMIICWGINLRQFTQCNPFWGLSPNTSTFTHTIGLIPYVSIVTVWFPVKNSSDKK